MKKLILKLIWSFVRWSYYNKDGEPTKCPVCGGTHFIHDTKDSIDGHVSEFSAECSQCFYEAGYWAYGSWDTESIKSVPPIINRLSVDTDL